MQQCVTLTLIYLSISIIGIYSICPLLELNPNVVVICSDKNGQNVGRKFFKCTTNDTVNQINVGIVAIYQCDKYYKPISRRLNGGRLQCGENGVWTNYAAFRKFQCELDCGKRPAFYNQLISSGNDTNANLWPWIATIYRETSHHEFKYICGGSLIGLYTILTAAHCVADQYSNKFPVKKLRIVFGSISSNFSENIRDSASIHLVEDLFIHPEYHPDSLASDIAVIWLTKPVELTDSTFPICLPLSFEHDALILSTGNTGEIASFGIDGTGFAAKTLQYAQIPILSISTCNDEIKLIPTSEQFCAGNLINGSNICRGDSGSGLAFKSSDLNDNKNTYVIHGIASSTGDLTNGCAPVVLFTKVYTHIRWIQEILLAAESVGEAELFLKGHHISTSSITAGIPVALNNTTMKTQSKSDDCTNYRKPNSKSPSALEISNRRGFTLLCDQNTGIKLEETHSVQYTSAEKSALVLLYPFVKDILLEDYMHNDEYLIKFLRAKKYQLTDTTNMIRAAMEWRKENRMNEITKEDFTYFQKRYTIFFSGYDNEGRPVYVSATSLIDTQKMIQLGKFELFKRYLIRNLEEIAENIRAIGKKNVTQSIGIFDFAGIERRKHLCYQCLNLLTEFGRVYENYYPQQNYRIYVVNLPEIATEALDRLRSLMSEYTTKTVKLFGSNKEEWSKELLMQIPRDQLFKYYGGSKVVTEGTNRVQLAL